MASHCSQCRAVTAVDDRFCGDCGVLLSASPPVAAQGPPGQRVAPDEASAGVESRPAGSIPRLTASPDVGSAHWWWLAAVGLRLVLRSLGFMGFWPLLLVTHVIVVPLAAVGLTLLKPVRWTHAGLYTLALGLADPWLLMMAAVDTGEMLVGPSVLITLVVSVSVALFARSRERARAGAGPR